MNLTVGDRVRHPTLHDVWGPGEVLAIDPSGKLTVYFALAGQKTLKGVQLEKLSDQEGTHPFLEDRIRAEKRGSKTRSVAALKEAFLRLFPGGFEDPNYLKSERDYKIAASELLRRTMDPETLATLASENGYAEISKRALAVVNATNLIFPNEKMDLKDGLSNPEGAELFSRRLIDLLYGSEAFQTRFDAFSDALERIGAAKWTVVTYFPFLALPEEHIFLKPVVTQAAATACNFELHYRSELNWQTYEALLRFAESLRGLVEDLRPRDMIDLQSFIWCIGERV